MSSTEENQVRPEDWAATVRRETHVHIGDERKVQLENDPYDMRFPPGPTQHERLKQIRAATNPLLEAASPLLLALAQMPSVAPLIEDAGVSAGAAHIEALRELLKREVREFQSLCKQAEMDATNIAVVSYFLCTALDEAANHTAWGGGALGSELGPWARDPLAGEFHGDTSGGIKAFLLIGPLVMHEPERHRDLLAVIFQVLSLGFEGQYRLMPDGHVSLVHIRQHVHAVMTTKPAVSPVLASQIQVEPVQVSRKLPVWVSAAVMAVVVVSTFGIYEYRLSLLRQQTIDKIIATGNMTETLAAPTPTSPTSAPPPAMSPASAANN